VESVLIGLGKCGGSVHGDVSSSIDEDVDVSISSDRSARVQVRGLSIWARFI